MNRLPLAHATRLGAASPSQRMEVGVGLKDPHPAAEQALLSAQQNPASSQYHHFLTPAQYDKKFAVSKTSFQHTLSWLRGGGATILDTSAARNFVEISATVSQLDRLFQTSIGRYEAQGVRFLANQSAPSVPAGLHVLTVMGLNTLIHPTTPLAGASAANRAPGSSLLGQATDPSALKSIAGEGSLVNSISSTLGIAGILGKAAAGAPTIPAALTPQTLWSVYDMPGANIGQGQSVAVMGSATRAPRSRTWRSSSRSSSCRSSRSRSPTSPRTATSPTPAATSSGSWTPRPPRAWPPASSRSTCTSPST